MYRVQPLYIRRIAFKINLFYLTEFFENINHKRAEFHKVALGNRSQTMSKNTVVPEKYHGADPFQLIHRTPGLYFRDRIIERQKQYKAIQKGNLFRKIRTDFPPGEQDLYGLL